MNKFLFLAFLLLPFSAVAAENHDLHKPMTFERVIDGDTIVASGHKIRLWGIDAPEKGTKYYKLATLFLQSLLKEGALSCKYIEQDRYKRDVMHCMTDKLDVGSMIVQAGMAKDKKRYSGGYYQYEETEARKKKRGIWH